VTTQHDATTNEESPERVSSVLKTLWKDVTLLYGLFSFLLLCLKIERHRVRANIEYELIRTYSQYSAAGVRDDRCNDSDDTCCTSRERLDPTGSLLTGRRAAASERTVST